jgi:S1-C subfamily serine protease
VRALVSAGLLAAATAGPAAPSGAVPVDLSANPIERAWLEALPAVYRLDVRVRVAELRTGAGRRIALPRIAQEGLREQGTAFAVSPQGVVVAARHVVAPANADLAAAAWLLARVHTGHPRDTLAQAVRWVAAHRVRPVGVTVTAVVLRPAVPQAGSATRPREYRAQVLATSPSDDLALLRTSLRNTPALALEGSSSVGTRVVVLGFGGESRGLTPDDRQLLVPARRPGVIVRTFTRQRVLITSDIQKGDSGGPAVDAQGRARGMVFELVRKHPGGLIKSADTIRALLRRVGVTNDAGPTTARFVAALARVRRYDLPGARAELRETLRLFPTHPVARLELARVGTLERAGYRLTGPSRRRGALLALGVLSALAAVACAVGLLRPRAPGPAVRPHSRGA